ALGLTVTVPAEDTYLTSREQLLARMAAELGGRVAEELVFGDITTGAKGDIDSVTNIARRMACDFGMSDLGIVALTRRGDENAPLVSEDLSAKVDDACNRLISESYEIARRILTEKREIM